MNTLLCMGCIYILCVFQLRACELRSCKYLICWREKVLKITNFTQFLMLFQSSRSIQSPIYTIHSYLIHIAKHKHKHNNINAGYIFHKQFIFE